MKSQDSALGPIEQLHDRIYAVLLDRLIRKELAAGQRLVVDDLAEELGTSITPVRESLYRLQEEGLLTRVPYRGWTVRVFTRNEVAEIYQVRAMLESFAAELCCTHINADTLSQLEDWQRIGEQALAAGDLEAYQRYDDHFHGLIFETAGNRTLSHMMRSIRKQVRLFAGQTIRIPGRPQRGIREHSEIIQEIGLHDSTRASHLMRNHILAALDDILSHMKEPEEQLVQGDELTQPAPL